MVYVVSRPPELRSAEELRQWTETELDAIAKQFGETTELELRPSSHAPDNPREGMIIYADGTNYDPGFGAGVYVFKNGVFVPLGGGRPVLTAARTYFVRVDGNDANTGLVNSAAGAWLTLPHAEAVLRTLDFNGFPVTVQVGPGTYTGNVAFTTPFVGGIPLFLGDIATPTNVLVSTVGNTVTVQNGVRVNFAGFEFRSSAGDLLSVDTGGQVNLLGNMRYGTSGAFSSDLIARNNAIIIVSTGYSIIGTHYAHMYVFNGARIQNVNKGVTVAGATNCNLAFAFADVSGSILSFGLEVSAAVTGTGARAQAGGIIFTNNDPRWSPPNTYPGTLPNSTDGVGAIL